MMNIVEAVAVVFGLAAVWLTVRQNVWCWPAGLVQVLLYIFVFLESKLYSDMLLHMLYVVFQIYGWYHWLHGGENSSTLQISTLCYRSAWVGTVMFGGLVWGFFMTRYTDAAAPYPDAFIAVASITAQWLTTRKKIESWYFWIFVDVVAIAVYWYKGLYLTTGLYTIFLVMCILGLQQWRQKLSAVGPLVFIEELP